MIVINAKTYTQSAGVNAEQLATYCKQVQEETKQPIVLCVQGPDIHRSAKHITTYAQHVDTQEAGGHTGCIHIKSVLDNGAKGSLLNHSERRLAPEDIAKGVALLKEKGITSIVCVQDSEEAKTYAALAPDYIAIEPPELIGGDISVTTANPAIIQESVDAVHSINAEVKVLCGAGVKTGEDVAKAKELGAVGVLVASGVTKANDQEAAVRDLAQGL